MSHRTPEELLAAAGVPFVVHDHVPVATVADIVEALPFPAEAHVKTLAVDADGEVVLVCLRGSDRLQYGRLARALGVARDRVRPLPAERVRDELGMEPGGVCPLADADVRCVADSAVAALDRAFCGSGRVDATLELTAADLLRIARAELAELRADA